MILLRPSFGTEMNINRIHFIGLIPKDRTNTIEKALNEAAWHMQGWCRWQMGNSKTFDYDVNFYKTDHPAAWYSTFTEDPKAPYSEWYWANAQRDARDYAGARFYMEHDSWVIYLDAEIDEAHGQHAGGASVNGSGLCVLHAKDCASIRGKDPQWPLCRGLGGGLHETLHTLGLPHPEPGADWERAVMGVGYWRYPNAILTENDKWILDHHRFFEKHPPKAKPGICRYNDSRPRPNPRPYPVPVVRPVSKR